MKKRRNCCELLSVAVMAAVMFVSCDSIFPEKAKGEIRLKFSGPVVFETRSEVSVPGKEGDTMAIPDTNDFILTVVDSKGEVVYDGAYGLSPEAIEVAPGEYTVKAVSAEFERPDFGTPQYGDCQAVTVESGGSTFVVLTCYQINSGIRLKIDKDFTRVYPNGSLLLKGDDGKLLYSFTEKRIAYFNPGDISLILSDGANDRTLLTRRLLSREVLTVSIYAPSEGSNAIPVSLQIDTTRHWSFEEFVIGEDGKTYGNEVLSIAQAMDHIGSKDVWVRGYIVGGDLTSSKISFTPPFSSNTNIAIAARASVSEKSSCLSVKLQKGDIRNALNLVDNPDILGHEVFLKGDIVSSYYGIPGIQNITEYRFK